MSQTTYADDVAGFDGVMDAMVKYAEMQGAPTDHPSGHGDNGTQEVNTGARYDEHGEEIDKDPNSVESMADNSETPTNDKQDPNNLNPAPSGEGVPDTRDRPNDPGTSHPADVSLEKSAFVREVEGVVAQYGVVKAAEMLRSSIEHDLLNFQKAASAGARRAQRDFGHERRVGFVKRAAASAAQEAIEDADNLIALFHKQAAAQRQQAGGKPTVKRAGDAGALAEELAAAGGGMPVGGDMANPEAAAGAEALASVGAGGGEEGVAPDDQALIAELSAALDEAGITPEELVQIAAQEAASGGDAVPMETKSAHVISNIALRNAVNAERFERRKPGYVEKRASRSEFEKLAACRAQFRDEIIGRAQRHNAVVNQWSVASEQMKKTAGAENTPQGKALTKLLGEYFGFLNQQA